MKRISIREFQTRCLRITEEVRATGAAIVVTKEGRAIAKLVPIERPHIDVFGCMARTARIVGDIESPIW